MTRKLSLFAAMAAALFFTSIAAEHIALARRVGGNTLTTVTQPDQWCQGGSNQGTANPATEVCLDWGGNLVPTTTAVQAIGSATLQWSSVFANGIVAGNTTSSRLHLPYATSITSQTMLTVNTTAGDQFVLWDAGNSRVWALAISTGGVNALVFSTNPIVAARQGP